LIGYEVFPTGHVPFKQVQVRLVANVPFELLFELLLDVLLAALLEGVLFVELLFIELLFD